MTIMDKYSTKWITETNIVDKSHCKGCEDDFYNGNNNVGVKKCWGLETAKLVMKKRVHINDVPPWKHVPIQVPSCFHIKKFVFVDVDR